MNQAGIDYYKNLINQLGKEFLKTTILGDIYYTNITQLLLISSLLSHCTTGTYLKSWRTEEDG